ncbi:Beta-D-xylosidase 1 [Forsythia ovata]|uniref:Beta-D-xylosidase 1 n=1 Tax=Forsythia ovata TaxID=205694 RepID=A0ABD1PJU7_9LAMI
MTENLPFCQVSLHIRDRVKDLIGRLTLQEKIRSLVDNAAPVERLGIKGYEWWSEALHGISDFGPGTKFGGEFPGATSFPQVILTAASFNASLWEAIGQVVSDEARAMYNGGLAGSNILESKWHRRRKQAEGRRPAANTTLHMILNLGMVLIVSISMPRVSKQDLEDTYNVPFKACVVEGRVASVMCSYNEVNGKPSCADPNLLRDTIRGQWHLNGYIVSDCDSVEVMFKDHHYTSTPEDAVAAAIKAGLDLDCGPFLGIYTESALRSGKLTESDVNTALSNLLTVQMRLGMFDGPRQPYGYLGPRDVCTPAHLQLTLEAARQGIVLLQNRGRSLPLSTRRHRTIAVIGPNSDASVTMIGNYAGDACGYTTPLQGIARYAKTIHQVGCNGVACNDSRQFGMAEGAARQADATVLVVGLDQSIEAEEKDRVGLLLPGHQQELVSRVAKASRGPVVLVVMSGGPVDVTFAKNDPMIGAILWVGYPGQAGGTAMADVLFGTTNPGGNLPMTWYPQDYVSKVSMTSMDMRANPSKGYPGRTYRFYKGPVVFPFGFGLSYTSFRSTLADAPTTISIPLTTLKTFKNSTMLSHGVRVTHTKCDPLITRLHIDVENVGDMDGTHTLMVFASSSGGKQVSEKQLVAFEKVHVVAGSRKRVVVDIDACKHLSMADKNGIRRIPLGLHNLHIGDDIKHTISLVASSF